MAGVLLRLLYGSLALFYACSADSTLNKLGCNDIAYVHNDKYVHCTLDSGVVDEVEECLNSSLSNSLPAGATVRWRINNKLVTNNSKDKTLPAFEILADGVLHLQSVSLNPPGNNYLGCQYVSSPEASCGPWTAINLTVFGSGIGDYRASHGPRLLVGGIPGVDKVAVIGRNHSLCFNILTQELNGTAFWTVNGLKVNATDRTIPVVDIYNYSKPECSTCTCLKDRYGAESDKAAFPRQNVSAFIVSLHDSPREDGMLRERGLCYYAPVTMSFLAIRTVSPAFNGSMNVEFTMADSNNQLATESITILTEYQQVDDGAKLHSLNVSALSLDSGKDAILLCKATMAGNSPYVLTWATKSHNLLPSLPTAVAHFDEISLNEVCNRRSGVFQLPLSPQFGPDLELDPAGATFLLQHSALVICNAKSSLSGSYLCFVDGINNTVNIVDVAVMEIVRTNVVIIVVLVVTVVVLLLLSVIISVILVRCRLSSKRRPMQMFPCDGQSFRQHQQVSATNQLIFEEGCIEREFPRDKLQLLSVLGEGQFGQVWKAIAEGICPQYVNRTTVAVKTLKPNAGWSDKDDLHSELDIMVSIEPHQNIINFLGMCSETDTEPLYILMEFALYGSLKDYLKKLVTGKMDAVYPGRPQASCSCTCHQGGMAGRSGLSHRAHLTAGPSLSLDSCEQNPVEAAHAARLFNLLEPSYSTSGSTCGYGQVDRSSHGSLESLSDYTGRCAYHPCTHDQYQYRYSYGGNRNDYYNSYYNHRGGSVQPPEKADLMSRGCANVSDGGEDGRSVGECVCTCQNNYTYQDGNEYTNVSATGCSYCAPDGQVPSGGIGPVSGGATCLVPVRGTNQVPGLVGPTKCCCCPPKSDSRGRKEKLGYFEFLDYACQISKGMEHLENMKCVHRDLAARNVLIAENFILKIGDFGLTRDLSGEDYYRKRSKSKIPARWMAVESLTEMKHTPKSDVWSYGVVLWEILTYGELPYGKTPMARSIETLASFLKSGHRLAQPVSCTSATYDVMMKCWDASPEQRPTFTELAEAFRLILQKSPEHYNRNIEEVPSHPAITQLETKIFQSLMLIPSPCEFTGSTSNRVSQDLYNAVMVPSYIETLKSGGSSTSSPDSGYPHLSEQANSTVPLATPYDPTAVTHPPEVERGHSSGSGLTTQDYLTLCRRDDEVSLSKLAVHLPEENKCSELSVKEECDQIPNGSLQHNVFSTETPPTIQTSPTIQTPPTIQTSPTIQTPPTIQTSPSPLNELQLCDLKSSPRTPRNTSSNNSAQDHSIAKSRSNWKLRETEV